jgi:hypothetical protein
MRPNPNRRSLIRVAGALSLTLFLVTLVAGVLSFFRSDFYQRLHQESRTEYSGWQVLSNRGLIRIGRLESHGAAMGRQSVPDGISWWHYTNETGGPGMMTRTLGFGFRTESWGDTPTFEYRNREVDLPYWFLLLLFVIVPARQFWLTVRRRAENGGAGNLGRERVTA